MIFVTPDHYDPYLCGVYALLCAWPGLMQGAAANRVRPGTEQH